MKEDGKMQMDELNEMSQVEFKEQLVNLINLKFDNVQSEV